LRGIILPSRSYKHLQLDKIASELGYRPEIDFELGLSDTVAWYRDRVDWWQPLKQRARLAR